MRPLRPWLRRVGQKHYYIPDKYLKLRAVLCPFLGKIPKNILFNLLNYVNSFRQGALSIAKVLCAERDNAIRTRPIKGCSHKGW